jgi:hypothetical protein
MATPRFRSSSPTLRAFAREETGLEKRVGV